MEHVSAQDRRSKELPEEMRRRVATLLASALLRKFRKKTPQAEMAERIGIKQPNLSLILAGKGSLGVHALIAIRNFCEVSIDELLGLPDLPKHGPITGDTHAEPDVAKLEASLVAVLEQLRREKKDGPPPDSEPPPVSPNVFPISTKKKGTP